MVLPGVQNINEFNLTMMLDITGFIPVAMIQKLNMLYRLHHAASHDNKCVATRFTASLPGETIARKRWCVRHKNKKGDRKVSLDCTRLLMLQPEMLFVSCKKIHNSAIKVKCRKNVTVFLFVLFRSCDSSLQLFKTTR